MKPSETRGFILATRLPLANQPAAIEGGKCCLLRKVPSQSTTGLFSCLFVCSSCFCVVSDYESRDTVWQVERGIDPQKFMITLDPHSGNLPVQSRTINHIRGLTPPCSSSISFSLLHFFFPATIIFCLGNATCLGK